MEYSAGLTSKLFWLQESRKTASYILEGLSKADIRKIAWEENIYQVKAEYRAYEVLNGTYRRVSALPEAVLQTFITCDVETAKILNLIAILMDSRLFFEFLHEIYAEKIRLGEKEITDRDLNVFFADKAMQSDVCNVEEDSSTGTILYRYQTREKTTTTTYYFRKPIYGEWSSWSESQYYPSDTRQVEERYEEHMIHPALGFFA